MRKKGLCGTNFKFYNDSLIDRTIDFENHSFTRLNNFDMFSSFSGKRKIFFRYGVKDLGVLDKRIVFE